MKLVEILAREMAVWKHEEIQELRQISDGSLCWRVGRSKRGSMDFYTLAEDFRSASITRQQWQAERERIASECRFNMTATEQDIEFIRSPFYQEMVIRNKLMKNKDLPNVNDTNVVDYEQQLWDKAYITAWTKSLDDVFQQQDYEVFLRATSGSAKMADDFMAERAKRLKK